MLLITTVLAQQWPRAKVSTSYRGIALFPSFPGCVIHIGGYPAHRTPPFFLSCVIHTWGYPVKAPGTPPLFPRLCHTHWGIPSPSHPSPLFSGGQPARRTPPLFPRLCHTYWRIPSPSHPSPLSPAVSYILEDTQPVAPIPSFPSCVIHTGGYPARRTHPLFPQLRHTYWRIPSPKHPVPLPSFPSCVIHTGGYPAHPPPLFSQQRHTSDFNAGTLEDSQPRARRYGVSARTG